MAKYAISDIIQAGRRAYGKLGEDFRMSDVAKELDTRASTLYRHVSNKRELYFAMLTEEYNIFNQEIKHIISQLDQPKPQQILQAVGKHILSMSRNDYERFSLMFLTKPPEVGAKSSIDQNESGDFEQSCNPETIQFVHDLILQHLSMRQLEVEHPEFITYAMISVVLGGGLATSPYYDRELNRGLLDKENYEQFHEFIIKRALDGFLGKY